MRKKLNKVFVFFIIFILLFSCAFYSFSENEPVENATNTTENQEETSYENEIEGLENQKTDIENKISSNESQIGIVEGVLTETLEEIEQLSTKIEKKRKEISNLEIQEFSLMNVIEEEEKKLEEISKRYNKEKKLLEKRLVVMYEMGDMSTLDLLMNSKSLSDFLSRYFLLSEIGKADKKLVEDVKKDKNQAESITR